MVKNFEHITMNINQLNICWRKIHYLKMKELANIYVESTNVINHNYHCTYEIEFSAVLYSDVYSELKYVYSNNLQNDLL